MSNKTTMTEITLNAIIIRKAIVAIETPVDIIIAKIATIKIARIAMIVTTKIARIAITVIIAIMTKMVMIAIIAKIAKMMITKATINTSLARTSVEVERRVVVVRVDKTAQENLRG